MVYRISYIPSYQIQAFKSGVPYLENQQQQPSVNEEPPSRRQQFAAIKSIFEQPKPFGQGLWFSKEIFQVYSVFNVACGNLPKF